MKKKVLVTGASGEIGTIVREDLASVYDLTPVARRKLPEPGSLRIDISRNYDALRNAMAGHDAVVHLAFTEENDSTTANLAMAKNTYRAALETEPRPRLIVASSIHAVGGHIDWDSEPYCFIARREYDKLSGWECDVVTDSHRLLPNGLYGALKCYIETLGEFYASQGLDVVVIRFGGVRRDDTIADEPGYRSFRLSRRDCAQIIRRAIDAELSQKFVRVFAVSDNRYRVHDLTSAKKLLGYEPLDSTE